MAMLMLGAFFDNVWNRLHGGIGFWTIFGLTGNVMFTSRFVVQWYASEKLKQSVIPKNFWHLSFLGGLINLVYALHIGAVPFVLGSLLPPIIAARNLMLIARHQPTRPGDGPADAPLPDDASGAPTAAAPGLSPEDVPGRPLPEPEREVVGGPVR